MSTCSRDGCPAIYEHPDPASHCSRVCASIDKGIGHLLRRIDQNEKLGRDVADLVVELSALEGVAEAYNAYALVLNRNMDSRREAARVLLAGSAREWLASR